MTRGSGAKHLVVDLGGTRVKAGVLLDGAWLPDEVVAHAHGGDLLAALDAVAVAADAVGLAVPGLVDGGRVLSLPGKLAGATTTDLPLETARRTGAKVVHVVNDAVAFALGEAGARSGRVLGVTLGTGVGVAVVEDGRPLGRGPLGAGVLGGQLPLPGPDDGGTDSCGRTGTLEARCCTEALLRTTGADDVDGAYAGDLAAYRDALVDGLVALVLAHAPDLVVVGGGAARPALLDGVQERVRARLFPGQTVEVRLSAHGDAAALVGLGRLLRDAS